MGKKVLINSPSPHEKAGKLLKLFAVRNVGVPQLLFQRVNREQRNAAQALQSGVDDFTPGRINRRLEGWIASLFKLLTKRLSRTAEAG